MVVLFNGGGAKRMYSSAREKKRERRARAFVGREQKREKKGKMCRVRAWPRERWAGNLIYWPRRLIVSMAFTIP